MKKHDRLNRIIFIFLPLVIMSLVMGCSSEQSTSSKEPTAPSVENSGPKKGGTITVAFEAEPDMLDVHKTVGGATVVDEISGWMGGSLVYFDPDTQELKPSLAEEYSISEDGKTWTFKIRSGITFHDGTPLTAQSFKQTYERIMDPETQAVTTRTLIEAVESVEAPDDTTFILHLKQPSASLLLNLSMPGWLQPLSISSIEERGADYGRNPVGVGPWKFESWQTGQAITLVRNDEFQWGEGNLENQGPPHADKLVIKFIKDNQTKIAALESGSIDVALNVPAKDVKKYRDNPNFEIIEKMRMGIGLILEMNLNREVFQDLQVRQAINMAINKEAIIQAVLQGEGIVAHGPLPPTIFGYDQAVEEYGYKYNQEEAKKLLDQAGWVTGADGIREKNGKKLSLELISMETWSKDAQLMQAMLGEIGIQVSITNMEAGAMLEAGAKGDFDMTMMAYTFIDPDIMHLMFHSSQANGGLNFSSVKDDKLDALLEQGQVEIDPEARKQVYAEVQKQIVEQAYWVPVYINKTFTVINSRVKGVKFPHDRLFFNDSWVNE